MQALNQVVMPARGLIVQKSKLVRPMITLVATEMTKESMQKLTMLQKTQAIHQTVIVMQTILIAISIKMMGFCTLTM
jgi:hypothetical protein